jgi:succinate dehydrogenase/fumarate reductase flavoprotein subunit
MDIDIERSLLIKELKLAEDPSLLQAIKAVLYYGLKNEGRISIEQYNKELDEANARIEAGEFITQEDLEKEASQWKELKEEYSLHENNSDLSPKQKEELDWRIDEHLKNLGDLLEWEDVKKRLTAIS